MFDMIYYCDECNGWHRAHWNEDEGAWFDQDDEVRLNDSDDDTLAYLDYVIVSGTDPLKFLRPKTKVERWTARIVNALARPLVTHLRPAHGMLLYPRHESIPDDVLMFFSGEAEVPSFSAGSLHVNLPWTAIETKTAEELYCVKKTYIKYAIYLTADIEVTRPLDTCDRLRAAARREIAKLKKEAQCGAST